MENQFTLLMEYMSKVREVVKTRQSQKDREEGESRGIRSFLSLGQWINKNSSKVVAGIEANPEMFSRIMKEANKTLDTYIKTRTWNRVYWLASWEDMGEYTSHLRFHTSLRPQKRIELDPDFGDLEIVEEKFNLKVHLVWAPSDGFCMDNEEEAKFTRRKNQTIRNLRNRGFIVWGRGEETPGNTVSKNDSYELKTATHRGNVFGLLAEFFGLWEEVRMDEAMANAYYVDHKLPYCLELLAILGDD